MTLEVFETAQHEAAHVVVGVAVGLRLHTATVRHTPATNSEPEMLGYTWFHVFAGQRVAAALMYAAGVAWEEAIGGSYGWYDRDRIREYGFSRHAEKAFVRSAGAMLASLSGVHARVTRALLEKDLSAADITAIARGEALPVAE